MRLTAASGALLRECMNRAPQCRYLIRAQWSGGSGVLPGPQSCSPCGRPSNADPKATGMQSASGTESAVRMHTECMTATEWNERNRFAAASFGCVNATARLCWGGMSCGCGRSDATMWSPVPPVVAEQSRAALAASCFSGHRSDTSTSSPAGQPHAARCSGAERRHWSDQRTSAMAAEQGEKESTCTLGVSNSTLPIASGTLITEQRPTGAASVFNSDWASQTNDRDRCCSRLVQWMDLIMSPCIRLNFLYRLSLVSCVYPICVRRCIDQRAVGVRGPDVWERATRLIDEPNRIAWNRLHSSASSRRLHVQLPLPLQARCTAALRVPTACTRFPLSAAPVHHGDGRPFEIASRSTIHRPSVQCSTAERRWPPLLDVQAAPLLQPLRPSTTMTATMRNTPVQSDRRPATRTQAETTMQTTRPSQRQVRTRTANRWDERACLCSQSLVLNRPFVCRHCRCASAGVTLGGMSTTTSGGTRKVNVNNVPFSLVCALMVCSDTRMETPLQSH